MSIENIKAKVSFYYTELYLSYVNDFLTVEGFAANYGFSPDEANEVIEIGRKYHEQTI